MLVNFALVLVVILAFCGLVLDVGLMELKKLQLQNAADAAALGAMYGLQGSGDVATWQAAGAADAALNGFTASTTAPVVTVSFANPPTTGGYAGNTSAVQATVSQQYKPIFFAPSFTLSAQATALAPPVPCVYLMSNYSTLPSISSTNESISGSCPFYLGLSYQLTAGGGSTGDQYYVAGSSANSSGSVSPAPIFNWPAMQDPLSYVAAPTFASCDHTDFKVTTPKTLQPGTYCGNTSITTNGAVTLSPGTYIIAGSLNIGNGSNNLGPNPFLGSGVTIYMTQGGGYSYGTCTILNVNATLSAPTSGPLQGILFFSDRNMPPLGSGNPELIMNYWNPGSTMDGILYLPSQELSAEVPLTGVNYFGIVADNFSHALIGINFAAKADYSTLANGNPFRSGSGGMVQ